MASVDSLREIYDQLQDEESRDTYLARLNYLVTGDYRHMVRLVRKYFPEGGYGDAPLTDYFQALPKNRPIVLYGTGMDAMFLSRLWEELDWTHILGFSSRSVSSKWIGGFLGYPVISPEELLKRRDASVVITATLHTKQITKYLTQNGYPIDQIYSGLLPLYTEKDNHYFEPGIISFEDNEIFVDGGSYNLGDTIGMSRRCNMKKAYAFEPDLGNYANIEDQKRRMGLDNVNLYPLGLWSEHSFLHIDASGDTKSHIIEEETGTGVEVCSLDEVVNPSDRITMIKMDIEGAETEALKGCRRTIQRDHPKLAISIYHRPEDMVEIPMYIKELVPEYRLYLRHYSNRLSETVLYAVP